MRDIKFRGINVKTGEMVYGGGIDSQRDTPIIINHGERHFVDAKTVGQYTGLKDKNGVEIYGGDIIPYGDGKYAVEMCGPSWTFPEFVGSCYYGHDEPELQDWSRFEVIGNIHQNPELVG